MQNNAQDAAGKVEAVSGEIPQRPLGRTGVKVSALGLGGHHLGDLKTVEEAIRLVHEAVDAGITFCDNCWEYWNGRAQHWLVVLDGIVERLPVSRRQWPVLRELVADKP